VTTIAVAAKSRYERLKDVPTTAEFGVPIDLEGWQGVFAPPQTPRPIVERISKALAQVMAGPEVRSKYESMGVVPPVESHEEFVKLLPADTVRLGEIMRMANVQPQ
jgi:tripartite-type tricarboxylate transporter receptor subunit TctC